MIVIVKPHEIFLKKEEEINEKEVNISKCIFEFDGDITDEFVKEAIFVKDGKSIVKIIDNNECNYPPEILDSVGVCLIGVVATLTHDDEIIKRFNPSPQKFSITDGILREADNSQPITASELEQYKQALQNGLNEVKTELEKVIKTGDAVAAAGVYAEEQGNYAKGQAQIIIDSNTAATKIIKEFEENIEQHTTDFNENATTQTTNYNDNAKEKLETYNSNVETKTTDFNKNASDKTKTFDENVETKTTDYNANSEAKIKAYDDNASAKVKEYDDNATSKVEEYNQNADDKTEEFNKNADSYETRITENEKDIVDLESYLDNLTPKNSASGELVHITDALGLSTFETKTSGNVEQETTKGNQLLDFSKIQGHASAIPTFKDDVLTIVGTENSIIYNSASIVITSLIKNNPSKTLYLKYDKLETLVTANGTIGQLAIFYNDGTSATYNALILQNGTIRGYAIPSDTSNIETATLGIYTSNNSPAIVNTITITKPMLTFDENAEYEPYTGGQASPNLNYKQDIEVVEAYNLLKITTFTGGSKSQTKNGVTAIINDDGSITCKGTATSDTHFHFTKHDLDFTLGDGYFLCNSPSAKQRIEFYCVIDEVKKYLNSYGNGNFINAKTSFVFDSAYIYIAKDENVDVTFTPIFAKGTFQKSYLPYGCIGTKVNGKNLFNKDDPYMFLHNLTFDSTGVMVGTTTDTNAANFISTLIIPIKPNETYTISKKVASTMAMICESDEYPCLGKQITVIHINGKTVTTSKNAKYLLYKFYNTWGNEPNSYEEVVSGIQIELGDKETDCESNKEQITYLNLKGNFVGKIKDTDIKDLLVTDKKKFWLVKNVGKYIVTGDEVFNMYTLNGITIFRFSFDEIKSYVQRYLCCNYFAFQDNGITKTNCISNRYGNFYNVEFSSNDYSTIDDFKALLKEKYNSGSPIEFLYRTKETEIIELGELPESIKTFEGTNNIQLLANLDTEIEVKYALDIKKYYDNKIAELSSQII